MYVHKHICYVYHRGETQHWLLLIYAIGTDNCRKLWRVSGFNVRKKTSGVHRVSKLLLQRQWFAFYP